MILVGNVVGLLFALVAFVVSVVAFPLLIERRIGAAAAAATSVKAVLHNPLTMALWGSDRRGRSAARIVAVFRRTGGGRPGARTRDLAPVPEGGRAGSAAARGQPKPPRVARYAADFPSVMFTGWGRRR